MSGNTLTGGDPLGLASIKHAQKLALGLQATIDNFLETRYTSVVGFSSDKTAQVTLDARGWVSSVTVCRGWDAFNVLDRLADNLGEAQEAALLEYAEIVQMLLGSYMDAMPAPSEIPMDDPLSAGAASLNDSDGMSGQTAVDVAERVLALSPSEWIEVGEREQIRISHRVDFDVVGGKVEGFSADHRALAQLSTDEVNRELALVLEYRLAHGVQRRLESFTHEVNNLSRQVLFAFETLGQG